MHLHTTRTSMYMQCEHGTTQRRSPVMIKRLISSILGQLLLVPRSGTILGGTPVRVYGPCAQNPKDIKCAFDTEEVGGKYYPDRGQFVCVTPRFQKTGRVQFTLTFTSDTGEEQTQSSIFSVGKLLFSSIHRLSFTVTTTLIRGQVHHAPSISYS